MGLSADSKRSAGTAWTGDYSTYARQDPVAFLSLLGSMPVEVIVLLLTLHLPPWNSAATAVTYAGAKGNPYAGWGDSTAEEELGECCRQL